MVFPVAALAAAIVVAGAVKFENHDSSCSACHTEPESTYVSRAKSEPQGLASFHASKGVHCVSCHSGRGIIGRAGAMALGGRDLLVFASGHYPQPAVNTRSIGDGNCVKCHRDYNRDQVFGNHFHVFLPRWQSVDRAAAACVDCHQGHRTDGDAGIAFLEERSTAAVGQACHRVAGG